MRMTRGAGFTAARRGGGERVSRLQTLRRGLGGRGTPIAVNLAPMIDVTFLLLIFFLVTTTFERAEGILASDLPRGDVAHAVALPVSPIVIRLAQTGVGHDDCTISIDRVQNVPQRFDELSGFLHGIHEQPGFDKQTPVVIVSEHNVHWDHVVGCWNAALRAGCERVAFGEP